MIIVGDTKAFRIVSFDDTAHTKSDYCMVGMVCVTEWKHIFVRDSESKVKASF